VRFDFAGAHLVGLVIDRRQRDDLVDRSPNYFPVYMRAWFILLPAYVSADAKPTHGKQDVNEHNYHQIINCVSEKRILATWKKLNIIELARHPLHNM